MGRRGGNNLLTDMQIRALKPGDKMMRDGEYLYIVPKKNGSKLWQFRYKIKTEDGKRKDQTRSYGPYPKVTLKTARKLAEVDRELLAQGINPKEYHDQKKAEAQRKKEEEEHRKKFTFEAVALRYLEEYYRYKVAKSTFTKVEQAFPRDIFPFIGKKYIDDVTAEEIIALMKAKDATGAVDTAHRLHFYIKGVYDWAVANQIARRNPATDFKPTMVLPKAEERHYPTITDSQKLGKLVRDIRAYEKKSPLTSLALQLTLLTVVRNQTARRARFEDFDLDRGLWSVPAEDMKRRKDKKKKGKPFIIPLSRQAVEIVKRMREINAGRKYVFSTRYPGKGDEPISEGTMGKALSAMGYKRLFTPHSIRSAFHTIATEHDPTMELIIEAQLAHAVGDKVTQAYNRAEYIERRRVLMQWWADHLDEIAGTAPVREKPLDTGTSRPGTITPEMFRG